MSIKTTVITGATSGIGKETAQALAHKNHAVYMLVRDMMKGDAVRQEIIALTHNQNIFVIHCDLANLQSVRQAAEVLKDKLFSINVLINNAGGIFYQRQLSSDGYEMTLAVNHLGHFLLTLALMPLLEKGHARIINVSSEAHQIGKPNFEDIQSVSKYHTLKVYRTVKLYNIYFTKSLAERFQNKGITAFTLHPGVVSTAFWEGATGILRLLGFLSKPFMITAAAGAETSVYLATAPKLDSFSGKYFKKKKPAASSKLSENKSIRDQLWDVSLQLIAEKID